MNLTLRTFGAVAWGAAVVGASLLTRSQTPRQPTNTAALRTSSSAPGSEHAPAWIEGFSAGFEPVVQMSGEIVPPRRLRREDSSGWSPVETSISTGGAASPPESDARRTHPDLEIPPWVKVGLPSSITRRQPQPAGTMIQAEYSPERQPAAETIPPGLEDGWSTSAAPSAAPRAISAAAPIESVLPEPSSDRAIPLAPPPDLSAKKSVPAPAPRDADHADLRRERITSEISVLKTEKPVKRLIPDPVTSPPSPQPVAAEKRPVTKAEPTPKPAASDARSNREPDFMTDIATPAVPQGAEAERQAVASSEGVRIARIKDTLSQLKIEASERAKAEAARKAKAAAEAERVAAEAAEAEQAAAEAAAARAAEEAQAVRESDAKRMNDAVEVKPRPTPAEVTGEPEAAPVGPSPAVLRVSRIRTALEIYRRQQDELARSKAFAEPRSVDAPSTSDDGLPEEGAADPSSDEPDAEAGVEHAPMDPQVMSRILRLESELAALKDECRIARKQTTPEAAAASRVGSRPARVDGGASRNDERRVVGAAAERNAVGKGERFESKSASQTALEAARMARLEAELAALESEKSVKEGREGRRPASQEPARKVAPAAPLSSRSVGSSSLRRASAATNGESQPVRPYPSRMESAVPPQSAARGPQEFRAPKKSARGSFFPWMRSADEPPAAGLLEAPSSRPSGAVPSATDARRAMRAEHPRVGLGSAPIRGSWAEINDEVEAEEYSGRARKE